MTREDEIKIRMLAEHGDKDVIRIFEVAKNNPVVYAVFNHYRNSKISWNEALMVMVEELAKAYQSQIDSIIEHHNYCTSRPIYAGSEPSEKEKK